MLHTLDDYFILKEVTKYTNKNVNFYLTNHKENIIVLRHTRYIKRECIEYKYRENLTSLYNHLPLKEFAEYINLSRGMLEKKVDFMRKHPNLEIFKYTEIENIEYVVIDDELKKLLSSSLTPFIVCTNTDYRKHRPVASKYFANYCIGFY